MHGKTSDIIHDGLTIFKGLQNPFVAGRYHSLLVDRKTLPVVLMISAETEQGEIMGLRHRDFLVEGIQFHPESILTPSGKRILKNFLDLTKRTIHISGPRPFRGAEMESPAGLQKAGDAL
jgi:anthranilate synthase component 2/para-aminobenzoate synthetase component 2